MSISTANPIDTLQNIMDECCERHSQCIECPHLRSCRELWDRASEQTYAKPLTLELLEEYIQEFYQLWQTDDTSDEFEFFHNN